MIALKDHTAWRDDAFQVLQGRHRDRRRRIDSQPGYCPTLQIFELRRITIGFSYNAPPEVALPLREVWWKICRCIGFRDHLHARKPGHCRDTAFKKITAVHASHTTRFGRNCFHQPRQRRFIQLRHITHPKSSIVITKTNINEKHTKCKTN